MKKIGIITIVDNNNYGNRLQNYAVHKVYGELGYSCETLQLNQRKESKKYLFRRMRRFSGSALSGKDIYGKRGAGTSFSMDQQ